MASVSSACAIGRDAAVGRAVAVGTTVTDAAVRSVLSVDKHLGVSERVERLGLKDSATAMVTSLDTRFDLAGKYAVALAKVGHALTHARTHVRGCHIENLVVL